MSPPLGSPPATGKSFRFVRAFNAQCLDVKKDRSEIHRRASFPFSLFPHEPFPYPLWDLNLGLKTPANSKED